MHSHRKDDRDQMFKIDNLDCERFSVFVLSVLWRASVSKRLDFSEVGLGPYEDVVRNVIFGSCTLADVPAFELIVSCYWSRHLDMAGISYYPSKIKFLGLN